MALALTTVSHELDRSNLNNAYLSGMKEDLGFVGEYVQSMILLPTID
jgi:hypothetical protein